MRVKKYGLFIAFPPTVDLRSEGLGRLLAYFLKAGIANPDIKFVVACPSWTYDSLVDLCKSEKVDLNSLEIITLRKKPLLLRYYSFLNRLRKHAHKPGKPPISKFEKSEHPSFSLSNLRMMFEKWVVTVHSDVLGALLIVGGIILSPIVILLLAIKAALRMVRLVRIALPYAKHQMSLRFPGLYKNYKKLRSLAWQPKNIESILRAYQYMAEHEVRILIERINKRHDIAAWYSPTAFWPEFNTIKGPTLTCVPDVVLTNFPAAFATVGGQRFLSIFQRMEEAISGGQYFVTYSEETKTGTLEKRYGISSDKVAVIPHAANRLDLVLTPEPTSSPVTREAYEEHLLSAFQNKSFSPHYSKGFSNPSVRFFFYASQFRPHKNVMGLLRAYEFLLRKRYIGHKLILTGNPLVLPEIDAFIREHQLQNDVLCLHGLSAPQLAACYALADVAVNPSLSEGGCPFTFTEALSVDTPVVMARIPVTTEILNQPELESMYFNPYDWKDMAERMEWAVHNREALLAAQKPIYEQLAQRTWTNVVDEHLAVLDSIATQDAA
jgi:glycosyltransferase involved in cell wall biosynthesis